MKKIIFSIFIVFILFSVIGVTSVGVEKSDYENIENSLIVETPEVKEELILEKDLSNGLIYSETVEETVEFIPIKDMEEPIFILHAGGVTDKGVTGSNSVEALDKSYENGYKVMEIDFSWTSDKNIVCVHDWGGYYARKFGKWSLTTDEFESARFNTYDFTSLTLDHLAEWMELHPDIVIITDIKENNVEGVKIIAEKYPELIDRFCIQIYDESEYDEVYNLGFKNIIFTLYQLSWLEKIDTKSIVKFAKAHDLVGLTFSYELVELIPNYVDNLAKAGVPLFVHTVNDYHQQIKYLNMGFSGVYTDFGQAQEE